jgi:hypothetical protein
MGFSKNTASSTQVEALGAFYLRRAHIKEAGMFQEIKWADKQDNTIIAIGGDDRAWRVDEAAYRGGTRGASDVRWWAIL